MQAQLIRTYRLHDGAVSNLCIGGNSDIFISTGANHSLRINSLYNDEALHIQAVASPITAIVGFKDSFFVVTGQSTGQLVFWNTETGEAIRTIEAHTAEVTQLLLITDGKQLISVAKDNRLCIWDSVTGKLLHEAQLLDRDIAKITVSPNAVYLVSGERDNNDTNQLSVWRTSDGSYVRDFVSTHHGVNCLGFDERGENLVTCSPEGDILIWDWNTGEIIRTIETNLGISFGLLTPNSRYVLIAGHKPSLSLWNIAAGRRIYTFDPPSDKLTSAVFSRDSRYVVAGCRDGMGYIYRLNN